jgi:transposase-like protein
MVLTLVKCPHCVSDDVTKNGMSMNGKQRFLRGNKKRGHKTFIEHYTNNAYDPNIRSRIFFSIVNGSGTRATARTLGKPEDTVTSALRSIEALLWHVNYDCLNNRRGGIEVEIVPVNEAGMEGL